MKKILIVDDSKFSRTIVKKALESHLKDKGITVIEASNGKEALTKLKEEKPQVVLLDILMPDMTGINVLLEMKKQLNYMPKVIILSALNQEPLVKKALELGVKEMLVKPVNPKELANVIKKVMEGGG